IASRLTTRDRISNNRAKGDWKAMTKLIESTLRVLSGQLPGRVSRPGDGQYAAATAIWAKPVGRMPRTVVHCQSLQDIQLAIAAARSADLSLSVRGGWHDWAGRALCDGLVIDLSAMRDLAVSHDRRSARIAGGCRRDGRMQFR